MNKIIITGNLTRDPELRQTESGKSVTNFTVAFRRPFKAEETDFFPVVVWGKQAESCAKYLSKGRKVGVSGFLYSREYKASDGSPRRVMEICAEDVEFLSYNEQDEQKPAKAKPTLKPTEDDLPDFNEPKQTSTDDNDLPF